MPGRQPRSPATVTVCVPVYNGAEFVRETLQSACDQTWNDLRISVSVDRSVDNSVGICQEFLYDSRCTVIEQADRLGWVGNVNALLRTVDTEYFVILPHDDILDRRYVERLLEEARRVPSAAIVYSDIECFGDNNDRRYEAALTGETKSRIVEFLTGHGDAVAFRGLVRTSVSGRDTYLRDNVYDGFAADTLWLLQLVCRGELHRLPEALYRKRVSGSSVVRGWSAWDRDRLVASWIEHCAGCAEVALAAARDDGERQLFFFACFGRLLSTFQPLWSHKIRPQSITETVALTSFYANRLQRHGTIPDLGPFLSAPDVASLRAWCPPRKSARARVRGLLSSLIRRLKAPA